MVLETSEESTLEVYCHDLRQHYVSGNLLLPSEEEKVQTIANFVLHCSNYSYFPYSTD